MVKKISIVAIAVLLFSRALYAFEDGTLHGKIFDGFGKPVSAANVVTTSNGIKSKAISDATGAFSVSYAPGNIKLSFDKEGYVSVYIPLSLDEKTDLSVGDITLWKIPPKGGLFIVGDAGYTEINSVEYYSETSSKERRFYVKGSPTLFKGQNLKIIDFQTDNPLVIGKTIYRVDEKNSVGSINFYPSQKYALNKVEDSYSKIADNVGMRKINLPPGRYFYCTGEITTRSKVGYGFFFEISS